MNVFYDNFVGLCAKFNKAPSKVARDIGLSNAAATAWKNGKQPSEVTLVKLANYFSVSVAELTEEPTEKEKSPATNEGDKALEEFNLLFSQLSPEQQERELAYLRSLLTDANK